MMKTKFSSRVIALILTLGMLITCFPTFTFAEDAVAQTESEISPRVDASVEKIDDLRAYLTEWSKQLYTDITTVAIEYDEDYPELFYETNKTTIYQAYKSYGIFATEPTKDEEGEDGPLGVVLDEENKMVKFDETGLQAYLNAVSNYNAYKMSTVLSNYGELNNEFSCTRRGAKDLITSRKLYSYDVELYFGFNSEQEKIIPSDAEAYEMTTYNPLIIEGFDVIGTNVGNEDKRTTGIYYSPDIDSDDGEIILESYYPQARYTFGVADEYDYVISEPINIERLFFTLTDDFGAQVYSSAQFADYYWNDSTEEVVSLEPVYCETAYVRNGITDIPNNNTRINLYIDGVEDYYLNTSDNEFATNGWYPPTTGYDFYNAEGKILSSYSGSVRDGHTLTGSYPASVDPTSAMLEDEEYTYTFKGWVADYSDGYDAAFAVENLIDGPVVDMGTFEFTSEETYMIQFYPTFTKKKAASGDFGDDTRPETQSNIETFENGIYSFADGVITYAPESFTSATMATTDVNKYNQYTAGVGNNAYAELAGAGNKAFTIAKGMEASFDFASKDVVNNDIVKFSFDYYYPGGNMTNAVEADIFKIYNKETGKVAARLYASRGANKANFLMIADGLNYDDDYTANEVTNERAMGFPFNTQGTTTANYKASYYIRNSAGNYTNFGIDRANITGWRMDQAKWQHFDIYLDTINGVYYVMVDNKLLAKANYVDADVNSVDAIAMAAGTVYESAAYDNIAISELGYHVAFPTSDITVKDAETGDTLVTVQDAEFGRIVALPEINGDGRLIGVYKDAETYADRAYNKNGNNSYYGGYIVEPVVGDVTLYATFDNSVSSNANYTLDASGDAVITRNKIESGTNMNYIATGNPQGINFADRSWSYTATSDEIGGFAKISGSWEAGTVDFGGLYAYIGEDDIGTPGKESADEGKKPFFSATTAEDREHGFVYFLNPITENRNSNNLVLEMANTDTLGAGNKIKMSYDVKIGYLAEAAYADAPATVKFGSVMGAVAKNVQGTTLEANLPVLSMTADETFGLAVYDGNGFRILVPANEVTGKWLTIVYDFDTVLKKATVTVKEGETVLATQTVNFLDNNGKQADRITSFVWGANNSTWESSAYLDNFKVEENPADNAAAVVEPTYLNKVIFHHNGNNLNDWSVRYVADGATATTVGMTANPVKNADTNYSYNFQGWSTGEEDQADAYYTGITNVTKDLEVAPMWEKSTQKYTVTILNSAEQTLSTQEVQAYTAPEYPGALTKEDAADGTKYEFMGWIAKAGSHIGNKALTADGTTLFVDFTDATEEELDDIGTTVEVNNIKYTIADFAAMQVTGDSTFKPLFKETYADPITVNFYNEAGTSVYATRTTGRGMTILNMPANPTKANTNDGTFSYSWTFDGWYTGSNGTGTKVDPTNVQDTATYFTEKEVSLYPNFSKTRTAVRVVLYNDDNTKLFDGYVSASNKPNYTAIPKKTSTSTVAYTFNGWLPCDAEGNVTGELLPYTSGKSNEALPETVVATAENVYYYKASYADGEKQYVINFYDNAGTVLRTATVPYTGIAGVAVPDVPTADDNEQYTYSPGAWPYVANNALVPEEVAAAKAYINAEGNFVVDIYAEYVKTPVENIPDTMETFEDVEITLLPNTNLFAINNSKLITKLGNNGSTASQASLQGDGLAHNVFGIVGEPGNAINNVLKIYNNKSNVAVGTIFYFDPVTIDSISNQTVTYKFKVKNVHETGFPTRFALGLQGQTTAGANRTITNIATDSTTGNLVLTNGAGVPKYMDNPSIGYNVDTKESAGVGTWFEVALTFNFVSNQYQLTIGDAVSDWITAAETVTNIDRLVLTTGSTQAADYTMYIDDLAIEGLKENAKSQFTVTYLTNNGNVNYSVRGTEVVAKGEDAPTAIEYDRSGEGYRLNGWTTDGEALYTKAEPITNVQANLNPYAVWTALESYEVNFYYDGAVLASLPEVYGGYSINSKWSKQVPATPVRPDGTRTVTLEDEYADSDRLYGFEAGTEIQQKQVFKGWAITEDGTNPKVVDGNVQILDLDEELIESNLKLMAYFEAEDVTYSVKYTLHNGELLEERIVYPGSYVTVRYGAIPAGPARANDDVFAYTFSKWSTDLTDVPVNEDMVIYPEYSREFYNGVPYIYEDFTNAKADYITYTDANGTEKTANYADVQSSFITKSYGKVVADYKAPATDPYNKIGTNNQYYFEPIDMSDADSQNIVINVKVRAKENLSNWNSSDIKIMYEGLNEGGFATLNLGKTIETRPEVFDWINYRAVLNYADRTYVLYAGDEEIATGTLPDMKAIHGVNIGGYFNNYGQIYIDELVVTRTGVTELPLEEREYTVTYMDADGVILNAVKVPYGEATPAYTGITPGYRAGIEFDGWTLDGEDVAKDGIVSNVTKNITLVAKYAEKEDGEFIGVLTNVSGYTANTLGNYQITRQYYVGQEVTVPRLTVRKYGSSATPSTVSYGTVLDDATTTVTIETGKNFYINWNTSKIDITANFITADGAATNTVAQTEGSAVNITHFGHVTDFMYDGYLYHAIGWYSEAPTYDYVNGTCTPNGIKISHYSTAYPEIYAAYELTAPEEGVALYVTADGVSEWKYFEADVEIPDLYDYLGIEIINPNDAYSVRRGDMTLTVDGVATKISPCKDAGAENAVMAFTPTAEMNGGTLNIPGYTGLKTKIEVNYKVAYGNRIQDKSTVVEYYAIAPTISANMPSDAKSFSTDFETYTLNGFNFTNLADPEDPANSIMWTGAGHLFGVTKGTAAELKELGYNIFAQPVVYRLDADYTVEEAPYYTLTYVDGNGEVVETLKWYKESGQEMPAFTGNTADVTKESVVEDGVIRGYKFASWKEAVVDDEAKTATVEAEFTEVVCARITLIIDGVPTVMDIAIDDAISVEDPVKEHENETKVWVFTGWSEEENGEIVELPATATVNATYYANFEEVDAAIITFMDGEDVLGTLKLAPGEMITPVAAPVYEGKVFTGWSDGETTISSSDLANTEATVSTTYTAQYMEVNVTGDYVFVSGAGDDANSGLTANEPVATIKKAYEVAVANDLDTVYVLSDSSVGAGFTIAQNVKFIGLEGADAAIIRDDNNGYAFTISADVVADFENLTFKYDGGQRANTFNVVAGATLVLTDVVATDMTGNTNFTTLVNGSKIQWTNVTFKDSSVAFNSNTSGTTFADGSYIHGLTFSNLSESSKDAYILGNIEITNMVIENFNSPTRIKTGADVTIDGLTIRDNTSTYTGYFLTLGARNVLTDVVIEGNTIPNSIIHAGAGVEVDGLTFRENTTSGTNGQMMYAVASTLDDVTLEGNTGFLRGLYVNGTTITNAYIKNNTFYGYALYSDNNTTPNTIKNLFAMGNDSTNKQAIIHGTKVSTFVLDGKTIVYTDDSTVAQNNAGLTTGAKITENFTGLVTVKNGAGWASAVQFADDNAKVDSALASLYSSAFGTGNAYYNGSAWANGDKNKAYTLTYASENDAYGTVIGGTNVASEYGKVNAVVFPADGYILAQFEDANGIVIPSTKVATTDAAFEGEEIYTLTVSASGEITAVFMDEDLATKVEFYDGETLLDARYYETGAEITAPANPTRESVDGVVYTFVGWNTDANATEGMELGLADEAKKFYAIFTSQQTYEIVFMNGEEELYRTTVNAGAEIVYAGETPVKVDPDHIVRYDFIGWNTDAEATEGIELGTATAGATYYAIFEEGPFSWKVTFVNDDGTELFVDAVEHEGTAEYEGETPVKTGEGYIYTFKGWDSPLGPITADTVITATYNAVETVVITFVDGDTTLDEIEVATGGTITYSGETPAKEGFKFLGWTADGGETILTTAQIEATPATATTTYVAWYVEVSGNIIYVSGEGNNANDGFTPDTALLTLKAAYDKAVAEGYNEVHILSDINYDTVSSTITMSEDVKFYAPDGAAIISNFTGGYKVAVSAGAVVEFNNVTFKNDGTDARSNIFNVVADATLVLTDVVATDMYGNNNFTTLVNGSKIQWTNVTFKNSSVAFNSNTTGTTFADGSYIHGLTFSNLSESSKDAYILGNIEITNMVIENFNSPTRIKTGADVTIDGLTIRNNTSTYTGYFLTLGTRNVLTDVVVEGNTVPNSIIHAGAAGIEIDGLTFRENTTSGTNGQMIYAVGSKLDNVTLEGNTGFNRGLYVKTNATITNAYIKDNTLYGSAIYTDEANYTANPVTIKNLFAMGNDSTNNQPVIGAGNKIGTIVLDGKTIVYTDDSTVAKNNAGLTTGAKITENFTGLVTVKNGTGWAGAVQFANDNAKVDSALASLYSSAFGTGNAYYNGSAWANGTNPYVLTYVSSDSTKGTVIGGTNVSSEYGKVNAVVFPADGCELTGFTDGEGNPITYTKVETTDAAFEGEEIYTLEVSASGTVIAVFDGEIVEEPTKYTITFVVGETSTEVSTVEGEVPVFADPIPEEGYEFAGWEAEDGTVYTDELPAATEDATYTAIFNTVAPTLYDIEFVVDGEVVYTWGYEIGENPVYNGEAEHLEKVGYTFKGWAAEENGTVIEGDLPAVTGVATYYAIFEIKTYEITFVVEGQDDVVITVDHGQTPSYGESDPVVEGFTFIGWTDVEEGTEAITIPAATANATYYAILEAESTGGDTTPILWGDVNQDGVISILDSTAILTYVSIMSGTYDGYSLGTTYGEILWGDVNCDGVISILDSTAILTYVSIMSGTYDGYSLGTTYDLVLQ